MTTSGTVRTTTEKDGRLCVVVGTTLTRKSIGSSRRGFDSASLFSLVYVIQATYLIANLRTLVYNSTTFARLTWPRFVR